MKRNQRLCIVSEVVVAGQDEERTVERAPCVSRRRRREHVLEECGDLCELTIRVGNTSLGQVSENKNGIRLKSRQGFSVSAFQVPMTKFNKRNLYANCTNTQEEYEYCTNYERAAVARRSSAEHVLRINQLSKKIRTSNIRIKQAVIYSCK